MSFGDVGLFIEIFLFIWAIHFSIIVILIKVSGLIIRITDIVVHLSGYLLMNHRISLWINPIFLSVLGFKQDSTSWMIGLVTLIMLLNVDAADVSFGTVSTLSEFVLVVLSSSTEMRNFPTIILLVFLFKEVRWRTYLLGNLKTVLFEIQRWHIAIVLDEGHWTMLLLWDVRSHSRIWAYVSHGGYRYSRISVFVIDLRLFETFGRHIWVSKIGWGLTSKSFIPFSTHVVLPVITCKDVIVIGGLLKLSFIYGLIEFFLLISVYISWCLASFRFLVVFLKRFINMIRTIEIWRWLMISINRLTGKIPLLLLLLIYQLLLLETLLRRLVLNSRWSQSLRWFYWLGPNIGFRKCWTHIYNIWDFFGFWLVFGTARVWFRAHWSNVFHLVMEFIWIYWWSFIYGLWF